MIKTNIRFHIGLIIFSGILFLLSSCDSNEDPDRIIEVRLLTESLEITKAEGSAKFEFSVSPSYQPTDFIWEGSDTNIQLYSVPSSSDSAEIYCIPSDYHISHIVSSLDEEGHIKPGQYCATITLTSDEAAGEDEVVLILTLPDRRGGLVKAVSQPMTISYGIRPNIYNIAIDGIEAEKVDASTFYVRLPYGTDCGSIPCEISANADISVGEIRNPKTIDLTNPVSLTAAIGSDSVSYSLIAYYSDLPIIYVNTPAPIISKEDWVKKCTIQIANAGEFNCIYEAAQLKGRGNSTWGFPKKPYAIKLDKKSEVLGMPRHKRWCLLANWIDRTNIRNEIAFETARRLSGLAWTPRGRFVDVVLNGQFVGNYYLCEQIKVDPNRVDIEEMSETDVAGEALTGGYLLELDTNFDEVNKFRSKELNLPVNFKDPDEDVLQPQQFAYMEDYFNDVEAKLIGHVDYSEIEKLIDIDSFIDWWFVHEITGNWEPNHPKSSYMYKPKGGKLTAGPVWDFDWGTFMKPFVWYGYNSIWYPYLFYYPEFMAKVKKRWTEIKPSMMTMPDYIQSVSDLIKASTEYDYSIWPIDRVVNGDEALSFQESIERIKQYYIDRISWLDINIPTMDED